MKSIAILGAGISGLCVAYFVNRRSPDAQISIFEKTERLGGVIRSEKIDDFVIDAGPDSFLTQKRAAFDLCSELKIENQLIGSLDHQRKTFIFHEGRLKLLPEGMFLMVPGSPLAFLRSDLVSWYGKFSVIKDIFLPPEQNDCSIADWTERRFGKEILHQIADPLLSGIYGSDSAALSLRSALPQLWELQQKGSLIVEIMKRRRAAAPASLFTTLHDGMQTLIDSLSANLSEHKISTGCCIERIERRDGAWLIQDKNYDDVVLASSSVPEIDSPNGEKIRKLLLTIRRNSAIVIVLAFKNVHREGFGWLVPAIDRKFVLACTYLSNKFPNRCPPDHLLLRLFISGKLAENSLEKSDEQILEMAQMDLRRICDINEDPVLSKIYRWPFAMPEYAVGHAEKIAAIKQLAAADGLILAGNILRGVGIPDCILQAQDAAQLLI